MSCQNKGLAVFDLVGRVLLAFIFLFAALGKIEDYDGTRLYMMSYGVPGALLPVVIAVELLGSLAIMVGLWTRYAALLLALFSIAAIVIFHQNLATMTNQIITLAEVSFTGGLILLAVNGAGCLSLDALVKRGKA
ncbi:DoxX family protein [Acidiferrobacter thiooxydans]|jgi:putative oxidoreductase|uniref:DoxX family protein n=1 Tax=Acidiferrobacter thiooxydans TaxID=163359 RepID=A0A1C2G439_9GAMM|nr:DoxX family protein [Acidiferrobacter thiooxydans]RCN59227.1 DoxX family protein [Acidiferrobacter thiooxydans]UEO00965.1 DoxX family protein [Acidiferrobacter thiooxydans]